MHFQDSVPLVQEVGWASESVSMGPENLAPTGVRTRTIQPVATRYTDAIPAT